MVRLHLLFLLARVTFFVGRTQIERIPNNHALYAHTRATMGPNLKDRFSVLVLSKKSHDDYQRLVVVGVKARRRPTCQFGFLWWFLTGPLAQLPLVTPTGG